MKVVVPPCLETWHCPAWHRTTLLHTEKTPANGELGGGKDQAVIVTKKAEVNVKNRSGKNATQREGIWKRHEVADKC